jgi:hypothetical protein
MSTTRPLSPTILNELAAYLAVADDRCMAVAHNTAVMADTRCPVCNLSTRDYRDALLKVRWP